MNRRYAYTFSFVMAVFMSVFMSGVVTAINLGVDGDFLRNWGAAWIKVFPIAFVALLTFRPLAGSITSRLVGPPFTRTDA